MIQASERFVRIADGAEVELVGREINSEGTKIIVWVREFDEKFDRIVTRSLFDSAFEEKYRRMA